MYLYYYFVKMLHILCIVSVLQNAVLELLQKSKIKIASLLPVEHRSHDDISKLMESKVKSSLCLSLATKCYILG